VSRISCVNNRYVDVLSRFVNTEQVHVLRVYWRLCTCRCYIVNIGKREREKDDVFFSSNLPLVAIFSRYNLAVE
jgi:hypothetical protein